MKVIFNGNEYELVQEAYISDDGMHYQAAAKNGEDDYMVFWETTEEWNNRQPDDKTDESDACDWDNPVRVDKI